MRVKIFTEGGQKIGLGHLSRCASLYDEIQRRGIEVEFIVQGDIDKVGFLEDKVILNKEWMDIKFLEESITNENYVIVDSYIANKEYYEVISQRAKKALYIDDYARIEYPTGIILNPELTCKRDRYIQSNNEVISGSKYVILRPSFQESNKRKISNGVQNVFVVMGGTDIQNITVSILNKLCRVNPNIIFHAVVNSNQYEKYISNNDYNNVNFYCNLSEKEICQMMLDTDLAITAAGQTIYELLATNTPFIAVQVAENQQDNVNSLKNNISPMLTLKYNDEDFYEELLATFQELKNQQCRQKIVDKMTGLVDGKGSKRIIDTLVEKEVYLRTIRNEDVNNVFDLSNKKYVREYSLNKETIPWEDHVKWFDSCLQDSNITSYVVTNTDNEFLGQVRFNIDHNVATISISLSEQIIGKGLSKNIMSQSIYKIFKERLDINELIAVVSKNNIASMKIFENLHFVSLEENDEFKKFILRRGEIFDN